MSRRLGPVLLALLAWALVSCESSYDDGVFGRFRYMLRLQGTVPLSLYPPISDRIGNIYVLGDAQAFREPFSFVTRAAGGYSPACRLTKGDAFSTHGWVGFADDRAWYWSGDALVMVPANGTCEAVLDLDPQTRSNLLFRAVMPWVRITATRRTLVALVQTPTDPVPFSAVVDLDQRLMTNVNRIAGDGPVTILGVGAEDDGDTRITLIARGEGSGAAMEALFFDEEANPTAVARVSGGTPPAYGVLGTLRRNAAGTVAGLTSLGSLVVFDTTGGGTVPIDPAVTPIGVHRWKDALYVVGTRDGRPVIVPLDDAGRPGEILAWTSSERAQANLAGAISVRNEFTFPVGELTWTSPPSAIGPGVFLSPSSPWPHAPDTTIWAVAGPVLGSDVSLPTTPVAIAPVGIAYP